MHLAQPAEPPAEQAADLLVTRMAYYDSSLGKTSHFFRRRQQIEANVALYHSSHDWNVVQVYEVCILVRLKRESRYRSRSYLKYRYNCQDLSRLCGSSYVGHC